MTAVASQRRVRRSRAGGRVRSTDSPDVAAASLFDDMGGEPTLDKLISGVWEGLVAHQRIPCPWCGGEMAPVYSAHARPTAGRCVDCGTTLD